MSLFRPYPIIQEAGLASRSGHQPPALSGSEGSSTDAAGGEPDLAAAGRATLSRLTEHHITIDGSHMAKHLKARILDGDGSGEEVATFELSDDDLQALQDFAAFAADLESNSLVLEGIPSSVTINWNEESGLKVEAAIPPDERIDALLMKLRPFLLQSESTFFGTVRNILARASDNNRVRQHLDSLRIVFSGERLQSVFVAGAAGPSYPQGAIVNSEEMLDLWLNGYRFHKEREKRRIFDAMHGLMPPESSIALLLFLLGDKVRAILGLRALIEVLQGKRENVMAQVILEEPRHYRVFLHATLEQLDMLDAGEPPRPIPEPGEPFERVIDLSHLEPANLTQLFDPIGKLWMAGVVEPTLGEHRLFLRVAKGFCDRGRPPAENPTDVIATIKVVAFIAEHPLSEARRKPAQALRARMRGELQKSGATPLRRIESAEELDKTLAREPKPVVEWVVVPRIVFRALHIGRSASGRERNSSGLPRRVALRPLRRLRAPISRAPGRSLKSPASPTRRPRQNERTREVSWPSTASAQSRRLKLAARHAPYCHVPPLHRRDVIT